MLFIFPFTERKKERQRDHMDSVMRQFNMAAHDPASSVQSSDCFALSDVETHI